MKFAQPHTIINKPRTIPFPCSQTAASLISHKDDCSVVVPSRFFRRQIPALAHTSLPHSTQTTNNLHLYHATLSANAVQPKRLVPPPPPSRTPACRGLGPGRGGGHRRGLSRYIMFLISGGRVPCVLSLVDKHTALKRITGD